MRKMMVFEDCRNQKSGAIRDITGGDTVAGLTWTTSGINDGDRIFASELLLAYKRILYMTAFEILQNQEDAEDAVMTAAGNIWKDLDKIKDLDTEVQKARILMTARNAARDIYRKNRKREACREGSIPGTTGREGGLGGRRAGDSVSAGRLWQAAEVCITVEGRVPAYPGHEIS